MANTINVNDCLNAIISDRSITLSIFSKRLNEKGKKANKTLLSVKCEFGARDRDEGLCKLASMSHTVQGEDVAPIITVRIPKDTDIVDELGTMGLAMSSSNKAPSDVIACFIAHCSGRDMTTFKVPGGLVRLNAIRAILKLEPIPEPKKTDKKDKTTV